VAETAEAEAKIAAFFPRLPNTFSRLFPRFFSVTQTVFKPPARKKKR
jgi:hypothetical protein